LPQAADRKADDVVEVALDPGHELGRHALNSIASGLVVPLRLVPVMCIPYTPARFNRRTVMEYTIPHMVGPFLTWSDHYTTTPGRL
jgi:hypothetical protein